MPFEVCRICLASNTKMYSIADIGVRLQDIYEKLTNKQWNTARRPLVICYLCHAHLKSCQKLIEYSRLSEEIFTQIFSYTEMEFTEETVAMLNSRRLRKLSVCLIEPLSINVSNNCNIKEESEISQQNEVKEEQDSTPSINNILQINHCNFGQENVIENVVAPNFGTPICEQSKTSQSNNMSDVNAHINSEDTKLKTEDQTFNVSKSVKTLNVSNNVQKNSSCLVLKFNLSTSNHLATTKNLKKKSTESSKDESSETSKRESFNSLYKCHTSDALFTKKKKILKSSFPCYICNKIFYTRTHLRVHMKIHTGVKNYKCKLCRKRFRQLTHLIQHHRTHTGEKPYRCEECYKKFRQLSNLKQHQRIHTGEKPYECDLCDKAFNQVGNLKTHIDNNHLQIS